MFLQRRRSRFQNDIFQANSFLHKSPGTSGIKVNGYFVSLRLCKMFEDAIMTNYESLGIDVGGEQMYPQLTLPIYISTFNSNSNLEISTPTVTSTNPSSVFTHCTTAYISPDVMYPICAPTISFLTPVQNLSNLPLLQLSTLPEQLVDKKIYSVVERKRKPDDHELQNNGDLKKSRSL